MKKPARNVQVSGSIPLLGFKSLHCKDLFF